MRMHENNIYLWIVIFIHMLNVILFEARQFIIASNSKTFSFSLEGAPLQPLERLQRALSEASAQLSSQKAAAERERVHQAELAEQVAALRRGIEDAAQREQAYTKQLRERDEASKAQARELERAVNDNSFL